MRYILVLFFFVGTLGVQGQVSGLVKSDGVMILTTTPTHTPCAVCSELVFSRADSTMYYYDRPSGPWRKYTFSTALVQDSILVHYKGAAEVGRDTIRFQASGVDSFYLDGDSLRLETTTENFAVFIGGGGAASVNLDIYRLPAINQYLPATGLAANESVTNYGFATVDPTEYKFSTTALGTSSTEFGGWLANGTSGDSIAISAPCGVVIGDSQAEGNPAADSRLTNGGAVFSPNYQDVYGTISFTLRQKTKMRWFNHGIGGQTSDQVWARWSRDVLANTFNPADGRGAKTLQRKPNIVVVIVGINDFYVHTNRSWRTTAENLENMARSARDNGIAAVFLNCPGDEIITLAQARKVDSLNTWMASGALQAFGSVIVDYNTWWRDPSYNDNAHGNSLIADDIHPTAVGYDSLANVIFRAAKLPVVTGVRFKNKLSPLGFSGYSRPSNITIQGVAHTISSDEQLVSFATPMAWDSTWIRISSSTNITGTSYSGFSHIEWRIENDTTDLYTRKPSLYTAYQGAATGLFARTGNVISPAAVANQVAFGRSTAPSVNTMLSVRGTTTDASVNTQFEGSTGLNPIVFTNNGRLGINRTGASYNLHVNGTMASETAAGYSFWNGPSSEIFASIPRIRMQSTNFNTGGTGRTDIDLLLDGNNYIIAPSSSASGGDFKFYIRSKISSYFFTVDVTTSRIGNVLVPAYGVDFSGARDGLVIPSGTTAQRGSTGGVLYGLRMNTDSSQVEITPLTATWHYLPRSAFPVKTSGLTGWGAGGLLTGITIGTGLTLTGSTLTSAPAVGTGGIYGGSGNIANNTAATLVANGFFRFVGANGTEVISMKDGTTAGLGSVALYSTRLAYIYGGDSTALWGARVQVKNPTTSLAGLLELHEARNNGTNSAKIQAPANLAADYTITTPPDDGGDRDVLMTDGTGVTSWKTNPRAEITATATRNYTLTSAATNYAIDTLTSAFLTEFTYSAGVLTYTGTATRRFLLNYALSVATDDDVIVTAGIDKNGAGPLTSTRQAMSTNTQVRPISGMGIVSLATNDTLKIVIQSDGVGAPIANIRHATLTITPID